MVKSFLCFLPLSTGGFVIGVSGILFTLAGFLSASYFFFIILKMLNYCQNCSTEVIGGKIIKNLLKRFNASLFSVFSGLYFICFLLFALQGFTFHLLICGSAQVSSMLFILKALFKNILFQRNHLKLFPTLVWLGLMMLLSGYLFYEKGDLWILGLLTVKGYAVVILYSLVVEFKTEKMEIDDKNII